jgi:hypothetical protein
VENKDMAEDTQWSDFPWGPIRSVLECFEYDDIVSIIAFTGLETRELVDLSQPYDKGRLLHLLDERFHYLETPQKRRFATIVVEEMLHWNPVLEQRLDYVLSRLGWSIVDGRPLPLEIIDRTELESLPSEGRNDLVKAATRLKGRRFKRCHLCGLRSNRFNNGENLGRKEFR